jgi:hypothetical protein
MFAAKHNSNRTNRKLTFQTLESRQLMAGNVSAAVINGDLVVKGDSHSNDIAIFQVMQQGQIIPGRYVISGLNGTTINHGTGGFSATGVNRDFLVEMNLGGNDHVAIGNMNPSNPNLTNASFVVPRNLKVTLDTSGDNNLEIKGITVRNNATITAGAGDNTMNIRGTFGTKSPFTTLPHGDLTIQAGGGNDLVEVHDGSVLHDLNIKLGGGQSGADVVDVLTMKVGHNLTIHSGGGDADGYNGIGIKDVRVGDDLTIEGGIANDFVGINNATVADRVFATLGHGDDTVSLTGVTARGAQSVFDGSVDDDTFLPPSNNDFGSFQPQILNFEHTN